MFLEMLPLSFHRACRDSWCPWEAERPNRASQRHSEMRRMAGARRRSILAPGSCSCVCRADASRGISSRVRWSPRRPQDRFGPPSAMATWTFASDSSARSLARWASERGCRTWSSSTVSLNTLPALTTLHNDNTVSYSINVSPRPVHSSPQDFPSNLSPTLSALSARLRLFLIVLVVKTPHHKQHRAISSYLPLYKRPSDIASKFLFFTYFFHYAYSFIYYQFFF